MQQPIVRRSAATIDQVRLALRDVPAIPKAESLELTHIEERLGLPALPDLLPPPANLDQLRAAVFAAPADDALRMVYADALISMGQSHGELIALQFARGVEGGVSLREAELLREYSLEWAGPLGVCSREVRYARGFPSVVVLRKSRWRTRRAIPAPEWATVEEIDAGELGDDSSCIHELLWKARLPALRKVSGVTASVASALEYSALRPGVEIAPIT